MIQVKMTISSFETYDSCKVLYSILCWSYFFFVIFFHSWFQLSWGSPRNLCLEKYVGISWLLVVPRIRIWIVEIAVKKRQTCRRKNQGTKAHAICTVRNVGWSNEISSSYRKKSAASHCCAFTHLVTSLFSAITSVIVRPLSRVPSRLVILKFFRASPSWLSRPRGCLTLFVL